jgi:hypothetical protein
MIDPKSFMEFFEKQYDVKFIDANTGKNALDIINDTNICGTCKHIAHGDGKALHVDDMVCVNPDSIHAGDFRASDDTCELWETTKKGE